MLYLIKKDLKDIFGNKKRILITLAVLIIIIISTSLYVSNRESVAIKELRLGVINEDSSAYSKLLLEYFKTSESFSSFITVYEGSQEKVVDEFHKGELDVYLCIPKGFSDNLIMLNHLPVEVVINGEDINRAILIENILRSYEKYIKAVEINCVALYDKMETAGFLEEFINKKNRDISFDLIFTALGKEKFFTFEAVGAYKNLSLLHYVMVSFLCTIILYLFVYMGLLLRKELDNGIYSRLYGAGVFVWLYILEKIIVFTGLIVLPVLVLEMIGRIFLSISISLNTLLSVVFIVLAGVSFVIFICALFRKTSDYLLTGNFMCLFFTIFGGGLIPIMYLPDEIIKLAHFTPTYWMIKLILLAETNQNTSSFYYSIPILSLGTFLFYLLSLLVYKKEALTHG